MYRSRALQPLIGVIMFFYCTIVSAQNDTVLTDSSEVSPLTEIIEKANQAYTDLDNEKALHHFSEAYALAPENYEVLWKLSRAYVDVGDTYEEIAKRKNYFSKGLDLSREAEQVNPNGSKAFLYQGVSIGRIALDTSAKERIRLSKVVKAKFDKAIKLDPQDDYAWHGLGRWHRKIATLNWLEKSFAKLFFGGVPKEASVEEAVNCFTKAAEINPGHINHHLELAISYEKSGNKDLAIASYKKVLALPKKDADDDRYKQTAKERLKKLE